MGMFIRVELSEARCRAGQPCQECVKLCPVNIFAWQRGPVAQVVREEEDECILCDLCTDKCPTDAIRIIKLYDSP